MASGNLREDGTFTAAGKGQVCIPTVEKNAQFKKIKVSRIEGERGTTNQYSPTRPRPSRRIKSALIVPRHARRGRV